MSYTNTDLVRRYLDLSFPVQSEVHDQIIVLDGDDYVTFFGGAVNAASLVVKSTRNCELTRASVTFNSLSVVIAGTPLVPGSVLLASDSSLGIIYNEGQDYVVDCANARVTLKDGGAIELGQVVAVWFQQYHIYSAGIDYLLDSFRGALRRIPSGDIGDGESVCLDYSPCFVSCLEQLVANAVAEANALVEKAVDPDRQFGADFALQGAATYRALEIICRASAARELTALSRNDKAAMAWMKIGDCHAARSEQLLSTFRPPCSGPAIPTKS